MVHLELIDFSEAKAGDLLIVPELTDSAELSVIEVRAIYATSFEAKGITGMVKLPKEGTKVVRVTTPNHPFRIEMFRRR